MCTNIIILGYMDGKLTCDKVLYIINIKFKDFT